MKFEFVDLGFSDIQCRFSFPSFKPDRESLVLRKDVVFCLGVLCHKMQNLFFLEASIEK